jgi:hypothetical protein
MFVLAINERRSMQIARYVIGITHACATRGHQLRWEAIDRQTFMKRYHRIIPGGVIYSGKDAPSARLSDELLTAPTRRVFDPTLYCGTSALNNFTGWDGTLEYLPASEWRSSDLVM